MPNGNKNNNDDKEIELLPPELRRPEEKKKRPEREEVKFFIPSVEEKPKGPIFGGKFFGAGAEKKISAGREVEVQKDRAAMEREMEVFKMQKEVKQPRAAAVPPVPSVPSPTALLPKPDFSRPEVPPKPSVAEKEMAPKSSAKVLPRAVPPVAKVSPVEKLTGPGVEPKGRKFGITLIPEEKTTAEGKKKPKRAMILVLVILVMVIIFGGLYFYLGQSVRTLATEILKVRADLAITNQKIKDVEEQKTQALTLQKQIKAANKLLENHIYWTNFFSFLEKNIVADVYFSNLVGTSDGQIILTSIAKSYGAVSKQIVSFKTAEEMESVSISSASASIDPEGKVSEVNFDARLKLKPEMFLK